MNDTLDEVLESQPFKLYSTSQMLGATFIGGPLATGVLMRENYLNLGKAEEGKKALMFGILGMVAIAVIALLIPESIMRRVPNVALPVAYMLIARELIRRFQEPLITAHTESGGELYSFWRSIGLGIACMIPFLAIVFGLAYVLPEDFDSAAYDAGIEEFTQNENASLQFYAMNDTDEELVSFLDNTAIPAWKRNLEILDELDAIEGLYEEYTEQNRKLRGYSQTRLELFSLISKSISEQSLAYDDAIEEANLLLEKQLDELNQ